MKKCQTLFFWAISRQIGHVWPTGVIKYKNDLYCLASYVDWILSSFIFIVIFWMFYVLSCKNVWNNGQNSVIRVIFHQNGRVWPPGETTYVVLGCCKALCLIGNAFLCISNSVFWVFDIFQKLKIAKNSYFFVFFYKI